ncbi:MAG: phosphoglucosamine mutase [Deltaproteobacteria bacterium]
MGKLFGTDGIRGEANRPPLDGITAFRVGEAVTCFFKRENERVRVAIGRDTRISGSMLECALAAGVAAMGGTAGLFGVLSTPGVALLTREMGMNAGIVISASHNPYTDNGIKIFKGDGFKLSDKMENRIEGFLFEGIPTASTPAPNEMGQVEWVGDVLPRYRRFLRGCFPEGMTMSGIRVVLDTANGATYHTAPGLFSELGADVKTLHHHPDGTNINDHCGSQYIQDLQERVKTDGADAGFAFDGDGDRLIAVDETGREVTGDQILLICAKSLKDQGRLKNNRLVSTVMSNIGLTEGCQRLGIERYASKVGDRYVLADMMRLNAVAGGEESGHIILLDYHTTSDGMITAMHLIAAMIREKKPLSELADLMRVYPQRLINVPVSRKKEITAVPALSRAIEAIEAELGPRGRVLIRYSGTQNLCRVMVEGPDPEQTDQYARQLADVVESTLG